MSLVQLAKEIGISYNTLKKYIYNIDINYNKKNKIDLFLLNNPSYYNIIKSNKYKNNNKNNKFLKYIKNEENINNIKTINSNESVLNIENTKTVNNDNFINYIKNNNNIKNRNNINNNDSIYNLFAFIKISNKNKINNDITTKNIDKYSSSINPNSNFYFKNITRYQNKEKDLQMFQNSDSKNITKYQNIKKFQKEVSSFKTSVKNFDTKYNKNDTKLKEVSKFFKQVSKILTPNITKMIPNIKNFNTILDEIDEINVQINKLLDILKRCQNFKIEKIDYLLTLVNKYNLKHINCISDYNNYINNYINTIRYLDYTRYLDSCIHDNNNINIDSQSLHEFDVQRSTEKKEVQTEEEKVNETTSNIVSDVKSSDKKKKKIVIKKNTQKIITNDNLIDVQDNDIVLEKDLENIELFNEKYNDTIVDNPINQEIDNDTEIKFSPDTDLIDESLVTKLDENFNLKIDEKQVNDKDIILSEIDNVTASDSKKTKKIHTHSLCVFSCNNNKGYPKKCSQDFICEKTDYISCTTELDNIFYKMYFDLTKQEYKFVKSDLKAKKDILDLKINKNLFKSMLIAMFNHKFYSTNLNYRTISSKYNEILLITKKIEQEGNMNKEINIDDLKIEVYQESYIDDYNKKHEFMKERVWDKELKEYISWCVEDVEIYSEQWRCSMDEVRKEFYRGYKENRKIELGLKEEPKLPHHNIPITDEEVEYYYNDFLKEIGIKKDE